MIKLFCVDVAGPAFPVDIDARETVGDLKKKIKAEQMYTFPAKDLRLFLAKTDKGRGPWLTQGDVLQGVSDTNDFEQLKFPGATLRAVGLASGRLGKVSDDAEAAGKGPVHMVVVVPSGIDVDVGQTIAPGSHTHELRYYQQRGELIQRQQQGYCKQILDKIDTLYTECLHPIPFICVEGSSGMGKSQLAFALGGRRQWFYWPVTTIGEDSQSLYKNFETISTAFDDITLKDNPMIKSETEVLNSCSSYYSTQRLWTYGFILALLKQLRLQPNQSTQMIHFEEKTVLNVDRCNRNAVAAYLETMKASGTVPFFVLDEMTPNSNIDGAGKNKAAFQRNVFRACGLVVIVMGTDAKITNLVNQSGGSSKQQHMWTTIVSRFPSMLCAEFEDGAKQNAWNQVSARSPVLLEIIKNSRGRFSRFFVESVVNFATTNSVITLTDLLDQAFAEVSRKTHHAKKFMHKQEGKDAQLAAISYTNTTISDYEPALKKRRCNMGTTSMHLHFANLEDEQLTDIAVADGLLYKSTSQKRWSPTCRFPAIDDDLLLYLAMLGGKNYSGYYDRAFDTPYSTLEIFIMHVKAKGKSTHENTRAVINDFKLFENMVAHSVFCASRKHGVGGILFDDFFKELLCEFIIKDAAVARDSLARDDALEMKVESSTAIDNDLSKKCIFIEGDCGMKYEQVAASDLLDGFDALAKLKETKIPFLAPPNAKWPQYILDTCATPKVSTGYADSPHVGGCNFGHLVRAMNKQRCDLYVEDVHGTTLFRCECKHRNANVDIGVITGIISGLNYACVEWALVLVFCVKLAKCKDPSKLVDVGCFKIDCKTRIGGWVFKPAESGRKKLMIVMEMGSLDDGAD